MFCTQCGNRVVENERFCTNCGQEFLISPPKKRKEVRLFFKIVIPIFIGLIVIGYLMALGETEYSDGDEYTGVLSELNPAIEAVGFFDDEKLYTVESVESSNIDEWMSHFQYDSSEPFLNEVSFQDRFYGPVVKVLCMGDKYTSQGSGVNMYEQGYVLTNLHVIGDDPAVECVVGFPDPITGLIREIYWATPIFEADNITDHDLAYLSVEVPFVDDDLNVYGYWSRLVNSSFPTFQQPDECLETPINLGTKILILGYPYLSGGALTVTSGLVSSLYSQDGYIVTSAKIGSGNSGGLAIEEDGCYVGVPTAVYSDYEEEQLGEIIDAEFVDEFEEAVRDDIDRYAEDFSNQ